MLPSCPPEQVGFAADLADRLDTVRGAGLLANVHSIVAARGGQVFLERYFAGVDSLRAKPLGVVHFTAETPHDLRSVSKSMVGLLYGIARGAGRVPPPEAPLLAQFPAYADLGADPDRQRLTVGHALSMTLGTAWDELSLPYSDPRNSEIAMDRAEDRCRFVLERPIVEPPGQRWIYNGGATAVLAHLIAAGTGQTLESFAQEALFTPLGITGATWHQGRDGVASAASGLRLRPQDLARIGALLLSQGRWNDRQLIPADWLRQAFTAAVSLPDGRRYGYHWYLGAVPMDDRVGGVHWEPTVSAVGNGGQRLFLVPRLRTH
jgi:CubicO group peptidase (beta-lactamase class C family)